MKIDFKDMEVVWTAGRGILRASGRGAARRTRLRLPNPQAGGRVEKLIPPWWWVW